MSERVKRRGDTKEGREGIEGKAERSAQPVSPVSGPVECGLRGIDCMQTRKTSNCIYVCM